MQKCIKILFIIMSSAIIVLVFSGCSNTDEEFDLWYENYESVSNSITELRNTDSYEKSNDEQKVELMKDCLEELQDGGAIKNLHYNNYIFHFNYSYDNIFGGVVVNDIHDDCWGSASSLSQRNKTLKQNIVEDFFNIFKRDNWQFVFGDNT